jgi:hypothetical protein
MFQVFGENELPMIKSTDPPSEIANWKEKEEVSDCYERLFKSMKDTDKLVLDRIIEKVLPSKEKPKVQVALVIAVCTTMLNLNCKKIQLDEKVMKSKVAHFLVSFCNLFKL